MLRGLVSEQGRLIGLGARRDEPGADERYTGNAEGAKQLQPDCDNASLAGLRLLGTKPDQGL